MVDPDLFLTIGVVLGVLTIPSLLSAWTDGRTPRLGAIMVFVAVIMVAVAANNKPTGYQISDVPTIMLNVVGRYLN
ncbi:MAG: hypothetical protein V4712_04445 [Pseudomonadota bacterium]